MSDLRIHAALSPRVAVLSSPDVDKVVQLNGLPDFPTLLRPFEASVERLSVRTSQLETRVCDRFPLRFDPYALFNPQALHPLDAARATPGDAPLVRTSSVGRTQEDLLDLVSHLISSNIKTWDSKCARVSLDLDEDVDTSHSSETESDTPSSLDAAIEELRRQPLDRLTPWFTAFQDLVFRQRYISRHETFGHPICILLAVSSASPDPMNAFAKLYEIASQQNPFPAHPYINPDTLKYYVLIHDVRTSGSDLTSSMEILEQVKKTYGLHCCLLPINSADEDRPESDPQIAELWSQVLPQSPTSPSVTSSDQSSSTATGIAKYIDVEDIRRIKGFIRELTAQSIVPFMERYVQHNSEHLANSRKGLTNRLFGASRKFFGGSSSASNKSGGSGQGSSSGGLSTSGGYNAQYDFYLYNSIEAQTRRLADFAFTIRDYKLAASMYDLGRKDFSGDKAFKHAAGATEMFGLSHLLIMYTSRSPPIDVDSYLAQACHEYRLRSTSSSVQAGAGSIANENSALRASLLYYEAYRMLGYLRPAPSGLLRMANMSDEILAPLLLEQAALSCLQLRPSPALRKHALYLVMAAHRYQACGQKILSLRCYAQAASIYRKKGWTLIENHIEHELGTQAYNDGDSDTAVEHLMRLLRPSANSSTEQEEFLRVLQTAYKYSGLSADGSEKSEPKKLKPHHPLIDAKASTLRFVPESSASATSLVEEAVWTRLEEELVERGLEDRIMHDGSKKKRKGPTASTSTRAREVPVNQTFWLDLAVQNPLGIRLTLGEIRPAFSVTSANASNSNADADSDPTPEQLDKGDLEIEDPGTISLEPWQSRVLRIAIRIKKETSSLQVSSVSYKLADSIPVVEPLVKTGKRLNATKQQRAGTVYAPDLTLTVSVHRARPTLNARIVDPPDRLMLGEERTLQVVLRNEGSTTIDDIRALCDHPDMATFQKANATTDETELTLPNHLDAAKPESLLLSDEEDVTLAAGQEVQVALTVRPTKSGALNLAWLIPFSSSDDDDDDGETYVSRLALSTHVVPLLDVSVQCRPNEEQEQIGFDLVLQAKNVSERESVALGRISFLSQTWQVAEESSNDTTDPRRSEEESIVVPPLQAWRGILRIRPLNSRGTEEAGSVYDQMVTKLQDLLLSRDIKRDSSPDVRLERSVVGLGEHNHHEEGHGEGNPNLPRSLLREARRVWRLQMLAHEFPTMTARDRLKIFPLWEPMDLDIFLDFHVVSDNISAAVPSSGVNGTWSARRGGQVHVYGLQPGPRSNRIRAIAHPDTTGTPGGSTGGIRSMYAQTVKEKASLLTNVLESRFGKDQNPVIVASRVKKTSTKGNLVGNGNGPAFGRRQEVNFTVRNFSDAYRAVVELQLLDASESEMLSGGTPLNGRSRSNQSSDTPWIGRKTLRCTLNAGSSAVLTAYRVKNDDEEEAEEQTTDSRPQHAAAAAAAGIHYTLTVECYLDDDNNNNDKKADVQHAQHMVCRFVERR